MKKLAASTAFCLIAVTLSGAANANDFARFDSRKIAVTGLNLALSPSASEDRIYLNRSMIKTTAKRAPRKLAIPTRGGPSAAVRHVIASAEAGGKGYDAVQHGARVKPPKRPTSMTIGEIYRWIAATPGQPHAIGRYQFIPNTLKTLVAEAGLSKSDVFTPRVQDLLAPIARRCGLYPLHEGQDQPPSLYGEPRPHLGRAAHVNGPVLLSRPCGQPGRHHVE